MTHCPICGNEQCEYFEFDLKHPLADSGNRTDMGDTGALRDIDTENKGRFDLLPYEALQEVAIHYAQGAEKYADRNWEKGLPLRSFIDSGLRHGHKLCGGLQDERHDRAWAWNALGYLWTRAKIVNNELPLSLAEGVLEFEAIRQERIQNATRPT